jgi:hypothetical protein
VVTLLLVAAATGCGRDDDGKSSPPPAASTSASTSGFTVTDGISPEDLLACLQDAGLPAALDDATPMGVEAPVKGIEVKPLTGDGSGEQGVQLWVFTDPTAARDNRAYINLTEEDTPTSWVAGNVVVGFFHLPDDGDPQVAAVGACLPA